VAQFRSLEGTPTAFSEKLDENYKIKLGEQMPLPGLELDTFRLIVSRITSTILGV
jgi:hypothetical protein